MDAPRRARWAVKHGAKGGLLQHLAGICGTTPLMNAANRGKVSEVRELLNLAADPNVRNDQGLTALEMARIKFGGHLPPLLEQHLDPNARDLAMTLVDQ